MRSLRRNRENHHCSLLSLTPITFDFNTFSCYGGSYFATIAVVFIFSEDLWNLLGHQCPPNPWYFLQVSLLTFQSIVPHQNCPLLLSTRPRGRCTHLHQHTTSATVLHMFGVTWHEHGACPPRLYTIYFSHLVKGWVPQVPFSLQWVTLDTLTITLSYNGTLSRRNIDEFQAIRMLLTSSIRGHLLSLKFHPKMVTGIQHLQTTISSPMDQKWPKIISKRSKTIQLVIKSGCAMTIQGARAHAPSRNIGKVHMCTMHDCGC
jgi:hypothetical protein